MAPFHPSVCLGRRGGGTFAQDIHQLAAGGADGACCKQEVRDQSRCLGLLLRPLRLRLTALGGSLGIEPAQVPANAAPRRGEFIWPAGAAPADNSGSKVLPPRVALVGPIDRKRRPLWALLEAGS